MGLPIGNPLEAAGRVKLVKLVHDLINKSRISYRLMCLLDRHRNLRLETVKLVDPTKGMESFKKDITIARSARTFFCSGGGSRAKVGTHNPRDQPSNAASRGIRH